LDTLAGLADVFLVRDQGANAISAVGVSQIVTMVVGVMMISVSAGAFTMVAQAIGADSPVEASATTKQASTLVTLVSIALSLIGITFSRFALEMLSMPPRSSS
jgi:Na+-driven multidrug efflux pump